MAVAPRGTTKTVTTNVRRINWVKVLIVALLCILVVKCYTIGRAVSILRQENAQVNHRSLGGAALPPRPNHNAAQSEPIQPEPVAGAKPKPPHPSQ
ncbi:MAG: hypothetical protein HQL49_09455 [Gammaproteobacteria bacterium]|nr:hypothetical protein [Gammaproteobacteria bacterium]